MVKLEREEKAEKLQYLWMGSNLEYKGIEKVLRDINPYIEKKSQKELTPEEINNEWRRLASFMSGKK